MANTANVDNAAQVGKDKNYLGIEGILYTKEEFLQLPHEHGVPKVVWAFWGGGPLTENRMRGITMMRDNLEVPVLLITPEHLHEFILDDHPLHEGYQYLCAVHQADYMRVYLWHNYGGAWHDIKPTAVSYKDAWQPFADPEIYLVAKEELSNYHISPIHDDTGEYWMQDCIGNVFSAQWWIGRKKTSLIGELMGKMHKVLDINLKKLKKYPATHPYGDPESAKRIVEMWYVDKKREHVEPPQKHFWRRRRQYPIGWTVFYMHPYTTTTFKYRNHVSTTLPYDVTPSLGYDYR